MLLREKPLWSGGPGLLELENRNGHGDKAAQETYEMDLTQPGAKAFKQPQNWLQRWWSPDPRKAPRVHTPGLAAYYWNGSSPAAHGIRDISSTGLYVVTEERWYPGTLVLMTLQRTIWARRCTERSIAVQSRAVRWGPDGVGLQFVLPAGSARDASGQLVSGTDRKELEALFAAAAEGKVKRLQEHREDGAAAGVRAPRQWRWTMKSLKNENGTVLVITAISLSILMGFMALAVDVGMLFRTQRQMQIAADAAAVAGALDYKYNQSASSAVTQGCAAATANGVTGTCTTGECSSSVTGVQVCMMVPPQDGPNTGTTGFVEAIVQYPYPTFFMRVFNMKAITVSGRAVAGAIGAGTGCVLTLARSGVDISYDRLRQHSRQLTAIFTMTQRFRCTRAIGSGAITADAIGIGGNYTSVGSGKLSPTPVTGMAPAADPLANLPPPTPQITPNPNSCTATSSSSACNPSYVGSTNNSMGPGTYTSISNTGSGKLTLTPGNYTILTNLTNTGSGGMILGAGNYTIDGNFQSTGSSSLTIASGAGGTDNGVIIVGGNLTLTGSGRAYGQCRNLLYREHHHRHRQQQHGPGSANFRSLQRRALLPVANRQQHYGDHRLVRNDD